MNDLSNRRDISSAHVMRQAQLDAIEAQLRISPDDIDARIDRANLLSFLDRRVEARDAFLELVQQFPTNFRVFNEFGNLLFSMGHITAARLVYTEATKQHPANPMGHVNLANLLLQGGNFEEARKHYELTLCIDPSHPEAHQGLGAALSVLGDRQGAKPHFEVAFCNRFLWTLPYRGTDKPIAVLKLISSGDGNIPTNSILDDRIFMTTVVVADFMQSAAALPPHQVIFNAIGDADGCTAALAMAESIVKRSIAPVINDPVAVGKTSRVSNAQRLGQLRYVRVPRTLAFSRELLTATDGPAALTDRGFDYPVLLRSPGFHTGRHFVLVNNAAELQPAAGALPGDDLLAIEYLNARGPDGSARKYRAMIVDGRLFPLHAAVSRQWKVHYFTADMADNPAHQAEDAAFLQDMVGAVGHKAMHGLNHIRDTLGLDYGGIDFGIGANGEVLLFEANATMVVNPPDVGAQWDYRRQAVSQILNTTRAMVARIAARAPLRSVG